ncbi:MAG: hydroxyacid dehydrogenase [Firmicutes bacterium]|nr:hydroxyacid dehydrogenase [Bacillota bacterium]
MKKVLVTEPIHEDGLKLLENEVEVVRADSTEPKELLKKALGCEGILIRSAKIPTELIKEVDTLKVIAKHGIGVDNVDVETATKLGVYVVNAPESNINAVAEHALGMILSLSKNFLMMDKELRKGDYGIRKRVVNMELKGKTIGLIGLGKIAVLLAEKLRPLGVNIIAYDPYIKTSDAKKIGVELVGDMNKVFERSDFVSVHIPLNEKTEGMIGKEQFHKMKESAYFINVARGAVVKEKELYEALKNREIKGAALDVFEQEPPASDNSLFKLDNVVVSPHNAALTDKALVAMATESAQGIIDCLNNKEPKYLVNTEVLNK